MRAHPPVRLMTGALAAALCLGSASGSLGPFSKVESARQLRGTGAHRNLTTDVQITFDSRPAFVEDGGRAELFLLDTMAPHVYTDLDHGFRADGVGVVAGGAIDTEAMTELSNATALLLHASICVETSFEGTAPSATCSGAGAGGATLTPLRGGRYALAWSVYIDAHLRYSYPRTGGPGQADFTLEAPELYFRGAKDGGSVGSAPGAIDAPGAPHLECLASGSSLASRVACMKRTLGATLVYRGFEAVGGSFPVGDEESGTAVTVLTLLCTLSSAGMLALLIHLKFGGDIKQAIQQSTGPAVVGAAPLVFGTLVGMATAAIAAKTLKYTLPTLPRSRT